MSLGILGTRPRPRRRLAVGSVPQAHIDLGPECVPGYPCSEAAEQRQIFDKGLNAFLNRARNPPGVLEAQNDPLLVEYQEAQSRLSPGYSAALTEQASQIATMREGMLNRRADLMQSRALHGQYVTVLPPPPMLYDAAWTGVPVRIRNRWQLP